MLGANAFYDYDLTKNHSRLGFGLESWTDFLQFSMNGYIGLSSKSPSSVRPNYQEAPAHGLDLRLHCWLPFLPRLGGKIFYEQYFGKNVSLFGRTDLQNNPFVITTGAEFTPFPLLSLGLDHRISSNSRHYTMFNLRLNYQFGESFVAQLNPHAVARMRFLNENRYNFVSRNNVIVFNYTEDAYNILVTPSTISDVEYTSLTVLLKCPDTKTISYFEWESREFTEAGGEISLVTSGKSEAEYKITLPPHKLQLASKQKTTPTNNYVLNIFAVDSTGQRSKTGTLTVTVNQDPQISINWQYLLNGQVVADLANLTPVANDRDAVQIEFTVIGTHGPLIGKEVLVRYAQGSEERYEVLLTDSQGKVLTPPIKTTEASLVEVDVIVNQVVDVIPILFVPDKTTAQVSRAITILQNNQPANGQDKAEVIFRIIDAHNNPIPNFPVTVAASNHATLDASSLTSDSQGQVKVSLTNTYSGETTVSATSNSDSQTARLEFLPVLQVDSPKVVVTAKSYTAGKNPISVTSSFSGTQQWSIQPSLPNQLQLDPRSGKISGTVQSEIGIPETSYTVYVGDSNGTQRASATFSLVVNPPFVVSQKLYRRVLSTDSHVNIHAFEITGGEPPYTVSVSPALPNGLTVDASGVISGRLGTGQIQEQEYVFTVQDQQRESKNISINLSVVTGAKVTIAIPKKMLTKNTSTTQGGTNYTPITASPSVPDGTVSFTNVTPTLPAGINLNSATGEITGTPTEESPLRVYTMSVRDGKSGSDSEADFELGVASSFVAQQSTYQKILGVNTPVSFPICALSGGVTPYSVSVTPTLPNGLQLNTTTGEIFGTATTISNQTQYSVTVTDANHSPRSPMTLMLTVATGPTITEKEKNKVAVIESYLNYTPLVATSAVSGKAVTFTEISPALPAGLSWRTNDGSIYGTPQVETLAGQETFTFTIRDGGTGAEVQSSFVLAVVQKLAFSQTTYSKTLPVNVAVDLTVLSITHGSGDYELIVPTSLPTGLKMSLDGTGVTQTVKLTGTPTGSQAEASYTFEVKDKRSGLSSGSRTLKLTISGGDTSRNWHAQSVLFNYIQAHQIQKQVYQENVTETVGLGLCANITFNSRYRKEKPLLRSRFYQVASDLNNKESFYGAFEKKIHLIKLGSGIIDSVGISWWGRDVLFNTLGQLGQLPLGIYNQGWLEVSGAPYQINAIPIFWDHWVFSKKYFGKIQLQKKSKY